VNHGEDEFFDLLRLDLGLGEELGGSEAELGHLGFGDLAAGVDDQRQGAEGGLLTEPLNQREAVAVGQGEVEDEEVGRPCDALADGLLAGGDVIDSNRCILKAGGEDAGEVFIVFNEEDIGRTLAVV
jgi:hypothetical protein